jgi:hypothetical protein
VMDALVLPIDPVALLWDEFWLINWFASVLKD